MLSLRKLGGRLRHQSQPSSPPPDGLSTSPSQPGPAGTSLSSPPVFSLPSLTEAQKIHPDLSSLVTSPVSSTSPTKQRRHSVDQLSKFSTQPLLSIPPAQTRPSVSPPKTLPRVSSVPLLNSPEQWSTFGKGNTLIYHRGRPGEPDSPPAPNSPTGSFIPLAPPPPRQASAGSSSEKPQRKRFFEHSSPYQLPLFQSPADSPPDISPESHSKRLSNLYGSTPSDSNSTHEQSTSSHRPNQGTFPPRSRQNSFGKRAFPSLPFTFGKTAPPRPRVDSIFTHDESAGPSSPPPPRRITPKSSNASSSRHSHKGSKRRSSADWNAQRALLTGADVWPAKFAEEIVKLSLTPQRQRAITTPSLPSTSRNPSTDDSLAPPRVRRTTTTSTMPPLISDISRETTTATNGPGTWKLDVDFNFGGGLGLVGDEEVSAMLRKDSDRSVRSRRSFDSRIRRRSARGSSSSITHTEALPSRIGPPPASLIAVHKPLSSDPSVAPPASTLNVSHPESPSETRTVHSFSSRHDSPASSSGTYTAGSPQALPFLNFTAPTPQPSPFRPMTTEHEAPAHVVRLVEAKAAGGHGEPTAESTTVRHVGPGPVLPIFNSADYTPDIMFSRPILMSPTESTSMRQQPPSPSPSPKKKSIGLPQPSSSLQVPSRKRTSSRQTGDDEDDDVVPDDGAPRLNSILLGGTGPNAPSSKRKRKRLPFEDEPLHHSSGPSSSSVSMHPQSSNQSPSASVVRHPSTSKTPGTAIRPPLAVHQRSPTRPISRSAHRSRSFSQDVRRSLDEGRPQNPRNASQLSIPVSAIFSPHISSAHDSRLHIKDPSIRRPGSYSSHRHIPVPIRDKWTFREALGVFQVQCFILGLILPPAWLVGGFWAIKDQGTPSGEKGVEPQRVAEAEIEWRFARKWQRRCRIAFILGLIIYALVIALAVVFGSMNKR